MVWDRGADPGCGFKFLSTEVVDARWLLGWLRAAETLRLGGCCLVAFVRPVHRLTAPEPELDLPLGPATESLVLMMFLLMPMLKSPLIVPGAARCVPVLSWPLRSRAHGGLPRPWLPQARAPVGDEARIEGLPPQGMVVLGKDSPHQPQVSPLKPLGHIPTKPLLHPIWLHCNQGLLPGPEDPPEWGHVSRLGPGAESHSAGQAPRCVPRGCP